HRFSCGSFSAKAMNYSSSRQEASRSLNGRSPINIDPAPARFSICIDPARVTAAPESFLPELFNSIAADLDRTTPSPIARTNYGRVAKGNVVVGNTACLTGIATWICSAQGIIEDICIPVVALAVVRGLYNWIRTHEAP